MPPAAARANSRDPRQISRRAPIAILAAGGALIVGIVVVSVDAGSTSQVATDGIRLAQDIVPVCAAGGPAARELGPQRCEQAAAVADTPDPVLLAPAQGVDYDLISQLVREEVARQPIPAGQRPTDTQVMTAARTVLEANPDLYRGRPGDPPSDEQVRAAALAVIATDPDAYRGEMGLTGDTGATGARGETGAPGRGIVASEQDPDDPCTRIVRYDQPPLEERWRTCADPAPAEPNEPPTTPPAPDPAANTPEDDEPGLMG